MRQIHGILSGLSSSVRKAKDLMVAAFLSLVYFILFGFFLAVVAVFDRRRLWPARDKESYWLAAEGYEHDINECMRQS